MLSYFLSNIWKADFESGRYNHQALQYREIKKKKKNTKQIYIIKVRIKEMLT